MLFAAGSVIIMFSMYYILTKQLYVTVSNLFSNSTTVEINVYALVVPLGFIGVLIFVLCAVFTAVKYKKQAFLIWSERTKIILNRMVGFFAFLGLLFAIGTYQWLTSELDARGYVYSEEQSTLSAMGKHEVYIKP